VKKTLLPTNDFVSVIINSKVTITQFRHWFVTHIGVLLAETCTSSAVIDFSSVSKMDYTSATVNCVAAFLYDSQQPHKQCRSL